MENYGLATLLQDTVGEWLLELGFKYDYAVKNYYVFGHENNDMIWYRQKFTDIYLLIERCVFRWIHMTAEESDQFGSYEK